MPISPPPLHVVGAPLTVRCSIIGNYKPTHTIFRQLSIQARTAPHSFTSRDDQPKLLSARVVRHPISPLARIWSAHIRITAAANAALLDAEKDWRRVDFEVVYAARDLQVIMNSYAEIPAGIRPLLLGRVMHCIMTQAAIWTKCEQLPPASLAGSVPPSTRVYIGFTSESSQSDRLERFPPFDVACWGRGTD
jgi:hypothetical protein